MPHLMKYSPLISINLSVNNSEISYSLDVPMIVCTLLGLPDRGIFEGLLLALAMHGIVQPDCIAPC